MFVQRKLLCVCIYDYYFGFDDQNRENYWGKEQLKHIYVFDIYCPVILKISEFIYYFKQYSAVNKYVHFAVFPTSAGLFLMHC